MKSTFRSRKGKFWLPFMLFGAGLVVFLPSVANFFVSDDFTLMDMNRVGSWRELRSFFTAPGFWDYYRPMVRLLFSLKFALFGLRPFGYHLTNIVLHGLNVVLVYHLIRRLMADISLALIAALFFAVHFIHTEAVVWISGVTGLLATCFYLLSVLFFVKHLSRWPAGWFLLVWSCFFFFLALFSKEMTVSLPLLVLVLALLLGFRQPGRSRRSLLWRTAPYGFLLLVVGVLRVGVRAKMPGFFEEGLFTGNPLIILRNLTYYGVNLVLPMRVLFDFLGYAGYTWLTVLFQRQAAVLCIPLVVLAGFFVFGIVWLFRKGSRPAKVGLIWMLVTLIPFLLFRDVGQRFAYLPSVGFCLLLADLFRPSKKGSAWKVNPLLVLLVLASLLAVQERNIWWRRAGCQAKVLVSQIRGFCGQIRTAHRLHVVGVPLRLHGAYIFNDGLDSAVRLVCGEDRLIVSQHQGLAMLEGEDLATGDLVLVFRDGELSPWRPSKNEPHEQGGD